MRLFSNLTTAYPYVYVSEHVLRYFDRGILIRKHKLTQWQLEDAISPMVTEVKKTRVRLVLGWDTVQLFKCCLSDEVS